MEEMTDTHRWLLTVAVMLVTILEVLDLTIVNVALPYMKGSLSTTNDEISWVLTSYVVSSGIMMPLTGYLLGRFGVRRLILINILGFLASSMLCGMSVSLQMMVLCRIGQGVFGAALVPVSQFILRSIFPQEQLTKAMAIWGVGIMAGPILGPTLGGIITSSLNWRWVFYVNIPFCIMAFFMCLQLLEEQDVHRVKTDWIGMFLLAVTVGAFQIFLDRGNNVDWFAAESMRWLFMIFITGFIVFIIRGILIKDNIINLRLFLNQNFSVGCIMLILFVSSMFSVLMLQPLLTESFMNYPASYAGLIMAPRGLASAFSMACIPFISRYLELRKLIVVGCLLCAIGTYMMTYLNLDVAPSAFVKLSIVQGIGMGFIFVPLSTLSLATLPREHYGEASGLFSFWRSLGISVGISVMITLLTDNSQINWNRLAGHVQNFNPNLQLWLTQAHMNLHDKATVFHLTNQVSNQAYMISFVNDFLLATFSFIIIIPLAFLLKKPAHSEIGIGHH